MLGHQEVAAYLSNKALYKMQSGQFSQRIQSTGYISTALFQGSINTERFEEFIINFVLPRYMHFLSWNLVLVMDNCAICRLEIISNVCASAGVLIRYLLPHSPDFNPIEYSFHNLKSWIWRNWIHAKEYTNFGSFL